MGDIRSVAQRINVFAAKRAARKYGTSASKIILAADQIKNMDLDFLGVGSPKQEKLYFAKDNAGINASLSGEDGILISRGWLYQVAAHPDDEDAKMALKSLIGHEHAHNIAYWESKFLQSSADKTVISYLNEVYADITGCQMAFGDDHDKAVKAMEWRGPLSQTDQIKHPCNASRTAYVRSGKCFEGVVDEVIAQAEAYINRKHPGRDYHFPENLRAEVKSKYPVVTVTRKTDSDHVVQTHAELSASKETKLSLKEVQNIPRQQEPENSKSISQKQKLNL